MSDLSLGGSGRIKAVCAWLEGSSQAGAEAATHLTGPRVAWPHLSGP